MATVYLHIGTPKTGTTAIQEFLYLNRSKLAENGISYPDCGSREFQTGKHNAYWLWTYGLNTREAQSRFDELGRLAEAYPKIILTEEILWNTKALKRKFWRELKQALRNRGIQLKIVVYLRRQDEYIHSKWAQRIKGNIHKNREGMVTFREYLDQSFSKTHLLHYDQVLSLLEKVVKRQNLVVRVYEKEQFRDGNIFSDFLDAVGEEFSQDYALPGRPSNTSLAGNVLEAKRLLNKQEEFTKNYTVFSLMKEVQSAMIEDGTFVEKSEFPLEKRREFMAQYEEGNRYIAKHYLGREDGVLFRGELHADYLEQEDYTQEEVAEVYGHMLMNLLDKNEALRTRVKAMREGNKELKKQLEAARREKRKRFKFLRRG